MFNLESAITAWRKELHKHPGIEPGYAEELESHLRDCIEDHVSRGLHEEDAFNKAKSQTVVDIEEIADEYYKVNALRHRKPFWKRKTDWLAFLPPHIIFTYFKQALRSFRAARSYFWINLLGLTLGVAASWVLVKYVSYEWRTDTMHSKLDRIAVATIKDTPLSEFQIFEPSLFTKNIDYASYPAIEAYSSVKIYNEPIEFDNRNIEARVLIGDSSFFEIFDFNLKVGNPTEILSDPNHFLVTEELAAKIFGNEDPLGQMISFEGEVFNVSGIIDEFNQNSSLQFDAIAAASARKFWGKMGFECLVLSDIKEIQQLNSEVAEQLRDHQQFTESTVRFIPFKDLYYDKTVDKIETIETGNKQYEHTLFVIAILILGISIFNYINLYAVILLKRGKELGVRKVMGAGRKELLLNFLFENLLSSSIAVFLAVFAIGFLRAGIVQFVGKEIFLDKVVDPWFLAGAPLLLTLITTLYPSIRYPRLHPIKTIKNMASGRKSLLGRKMMMTTQFVITVGLIIVSIFFAKQLFFMLDKDKGFDTDNIVKIRYFPNDIPYFRSSQAYKEDPEAAEAEYERLKAERKSKVQYVHDEINRDPDIQYLTYRDSPIDHFEISWKRTGERYDYHTTNTLSTTPNFINLFNIDVIEGRFFDRKKDNSREKKAVINEQAKKFFGIDDLDDAYISNRSWGDDEDPFKVIGVVNDFAYQHLSSDIRPLVILFWDDRETQAMMHLKEGNEQEALMRLEALYKEINPNDDFTYTFVDDEVQAIYEEDKKVVQIYTFFTLIALLISALGLFGISSYDVQLRIKEIGIRKISGASVRQLIQLLTKDFLKYLLIAIVIACPIAALAVIRYLDNFAYRTDLSAWVFVVASIFTIIVALATMLWHTYRAARRNPVEALRYE